MEQIERKDTSGVVVCRTWNDQLKRMQKVGRYHQNTMLGYRTQENVTLDVDCSSTV